MSHRKPKPKFIPPIRTAASFLRTVSKSPDLSLPSNPKQLNSKELILECFSPSSPILKDSGTFTDRSSLPPSARPLKGLSRLPQGLKSLSPEPDFKPPAQSPFVLPTNPEHLRLMFSASSRLSATRQGSRGKLCMKERCLDVLFESQPRDHKAALDESLKPSLGRSFHQGHQESESLQEWFHYMRETYLARLVRNEEFKKMQPEELETGLDVFELVLRAGAQEGIRQVALQSVEKSEIIAEVVRHYQLLMKIKSFYEKSKLKMQVDLLREEVEQLKAEMEKGRREGDERREVVMEN
jgi:hypothetical protein